LGFPFPSSFSSTSSTSSDIRVSRRACGNRSGTTRRDLLAVALVGQIYNDQLNGFVASLLARPIVAARQDALTAGTEAMPQRIAGAFAGYFPPELCRSVRWRVGGGVWSLPGVALQYGDALAITLIDVVLFQRAEDAQWNEKLWAHELTHVMQYRRRGIDGFAARYVADGNAVEAEAYRNADRYEAWRQAGHR
jgi:Domain of unknown function (DUF4157)